MAADDINAHGGVNGRKIEVITYDDHSSAADAVRAFQRAVNQDKVVAVIGSYISEVVLAIEPWSARLHMPFITPGAASNLISKHVHDDYDHLQIHVPRLADVRLHRAGDLRLHARHAGRSDAHEDRRDHERGCRLDHAARRQLPGMPAARPA